MISPLAVALGVAYAALIGLALVLTRDRRRSAGNFRVGRSAAILALLVVASSAFLAQGIDHGLVRDEGVFVVTNLEVANGRLPYTAAFDNTGPLGPWIGGFGVWLGRLGGWDGITSARIAYFPVALATVLVVLLLGARTRINVLAAAAGSLALIAIPSFSREALSGPRPKLLVALFVGLYLVALHKKRYMLGGLCLALATLAWQASFVLILVPIIFAVWKGPPNEPFKAVGRFLAGGLIPVAVILGIYSIAGELPALIEGFVTWNLTLGGSRLPTSIVDAVLNPSKDLWGAHQATWPLLVVGGLAILPFSRRIFTGPESSAPVGEVDAIDLVTVAFVVLVGWTLIDYQGVVDLFPLLPLAAFGVARVSDQVLMRSPVWSAALLAGLLVVGGVDLARTHNSELPEQRLELAWLVGDGCVASYGDPVALAIAGQSNPHRFFFDIPGLDSYLGDDASTYMRTLIAGSPAYVGGMPNPGGQNLANAVIDVLPSAGYQEVATGRFEGWVRRRSEGGNGICG